MIINNVRIKDFSDTVLFFSYSVWFQEGHGAPPAGKTANQQVGARRSDVFNHYCGISDISRRFC